MIIGNIPFRDIHKFLRVAANGKKCTNAATMYAIHDEVQKRYSVSQVPFVSFPGTTTAEVKNEQTRRFRSLLACSTRYVVVFKESILQNELLETFRRRENVEGP